MIRASMKTYPFSDSPATPEDPALGRTDLLPLGILALSLVALFWRAVFTSAMFFYRDVSTTVTRTPASSTRLAGRAIFRTGTRI